MMIQRSGSQFQKEVSSGTDRSKEAPCPKMETPGLKLEPRQWILALMDIISLELSIARSNGAKENILDTLSTALEKLKTRLFFIFYLVHFVNVLTMIPTSMFNLWGWEAF